MYIGAKNYNNILTGTLVSTNCLVFCVGPDEVETVAFGICCRESNSEVWWQCCWMKRDVVDMKLHLSGISVIKKSWISVLFLSRL